MSNVISHEHPTYKARWENSDGKGKHNGAYYYSREIVQRMIPAVKTDRNWVTIYVPGRAYDHCIYFVHNNLDADRYSFLRHYNDVVLVCGIPETCEKVAHLGTPIYLPLSVDVAEVESFKRPKTKGTCFAGRHTKRHGIILPSDIDYLEGMPREQLLERMALYEKCYAVGRVAIEAKILGCKILPYDPRFPDPDRWVPMDTLEAAKILQEKLDEIDGGTR